MKRFSLLFAVVALCAASADVASAQTPQHLSLYEPATGGGTQIIDHAPRSPVKNYASKRYRFSVGDQILFHQPILNRRGGRKLGRLYGEMTSMGGNTWRSLYMTVRFTYAFNNGDRIIAEGIVSYANAASNLAIVGGTGTYHGARGTLISTLADDGSTLEAFTFVP